MPKNMIVLRTFVASPSDVTDERSLLDNVISELNRTWSGSLGVMLDVIKWETSVRPGFDTDPQAVINAQVPLDYDILIGIFWGRVGTPTPRSRSGSLEEFDRAYQRYLDTRSPEILLYFKDEPMAPSKIDVEQLREIQQFRSSLGSKGGLYSAFDDISSFESSLRAHLSAVAQQFAKQLPISSEIVLPPQSLKSSEEVGEDDDYGYLDYFEIFEAKQAEMTEAMNVLNDATARIGEQLNQRAAEVGAQQPYDARTAQRLCRRSAENMNDYASVLQRQIATITAARIETYGALSKALAMRNESNAGGNDLQEIMSTLVSTQHATVGAGIEMRKMRDAAQALPRITKDLNKAKRAVVEQLDALLAELDSAHLTVGNIVEAIEKMIGDSGEPQH